MIYCNFDWHKCKNYITNLCDNNFKNNFDAIITSISIKGNYINNGYIYSNIDNKCQNLTL